MILNDFRPMFNHRFNVVLLISVKCVHWKRIWFIWFRSTENFNEHNQMRTNVCTVAVPMCCDCVCIMWKQKEKAITTTEIKCKANVNFHINLIEPESHVIIES